MKKTSLIFLICFLSLECKAGWNYDGLQSNTAYTTPKVEHNLPQQPTIQKEEASKDNSNEDINVEVENDDIKPVVETPSTEQNQTDEKILLSKHDKQRLERLNKIQEMRAKETNRFKQKAIANTEAREKRNEEALKRKNEKASRFQKAAFEDMEKEKQIRLEREQLPSSSRFTEKAKRKAEERALQKELREAELHRNKD